MGRRRQGKSLPLIEPLGWVLIPLILSPFAFIAFFAFEAWRGRPYFQAIEARAQTEFRPTPCEIKSVGWRDFTERNGNTYRVTSYEGHLVYKYTVAGREYESNRYSPREFDGPRFGTLQGVEDFAALHKAGSQFTCHFDPQDPSMAFLLR